MKKIRVKDIDICYETLGSGEPLVLIRGFTASKDEWSPRFLARLSQEYLVVTFDNRGAGNTEAPPGPFTMEQFADDTAGLMEALGMDTGYVLGESMGGMIAQELALDHPDRIRKLALCCTFCGGGEAAFPSQEVIEIMADRAGTPEEIVRRNLPVLFPQEWIAEHPSEIEDIVSRALRYPIREENAERQLEAILGFDSYGRLPAIEFPVLIACGSEDVIIPPVNSRTLNQMIPGSILVEYEHGGHGFIEQHPDEFALELLRFFGEQE